MKNKLHIIIETLLVGLLVFLLTITNILSPLENIASDSLYQIPRGIDSKIKIIGIDERTLEALGPIQTWSRENYAKLLNKLNKNADERPSVIAFDI